MCDYYGVIGNKDYIKIQGEALPFWEFLDEQPDGWLCSLVYKRTDIPKGLPVIWDCGAWTYKKERVPKLGKSELTPSRALLLYKEYATEGDFVVAPDHMLIGLKDDERRRINFDYALQFMEFFRGNLYKPMAVVHGVDTEEKFVRARELNNQGYDYLALGGVAFNAATRRSKIIEQVVELRRNLPNTYLHVMGLSSPNFAKIWSEIGIDSFDGASYFKQAFTAGKYYMFEEGELVDYQAVRPLECSPAFVDLLIPECSCLACCRLRGEGVDTRCYGSNESNMGRAAHNFNMLIKALRHVM